MLSPSSCTTLFLCPFLLSFSIYFPSSPIYHSPLSPQLMVPVVANDTNCTKWPNVVSQDLMRHTDTLKGTFCGQVKGKTLLPLPHQADLVAEAIESQSRCVRFFKFNREDIFS